MMKWLADNTPGLLTFLGAVIAAAFVCAGAYLAYRAQRIRAAVDKEQSAGTLALGIATELRSEVKTLRQSQERMELELRAERVHRYAVEDWARGHDEYDDAVDRELQRLDPAAANRLPERQPMPPFVPAVLPVPTPG